MSEEKFEYSELMIPKLVPRDHIRLRPGMYIGGIDERALHHLVYEVLDNSIEEVFVKTCSHIWLTLYPNDVVSIRDDSQGLPVFVSKYGKNLLEHIMTETGTYRVRGEYVVTGGLFGVGLSAVNALSAECTVEVKREGFLWQQSYREGVPQSEVTQVRPLDEGELTGTTITFRPDFTILEHNPFNYETLVERARELAYLLPELTLSLRNERTETVQETEFNFPNGLADYVRELNQGRLVLSEPLVTHEEWEIRPDARKEAYKIAVDVALQYTDTMETTIIGYVNTVKTTGGLHMETIPFAIAKTLDNQHIMEVEPPFTAAECLPGLTAVVSVNHPSPYFRNAMKVDFVSTDVVGIVFSAVSKALQSWRQKGYKTSLQKCLANRSTLRNKAQSGE